MILITGANGHLGSTTIEFLLKKNPDTKISGMVRSEEKGKDLKSKGVDLKMGDYFQKDTLNRALEGVETLLFISSSTIDKRVEQHQNVIEAAGRAGVQHIIYTSMVMADKRLSPLAFDHAETEELLQASGIPVTLSRHTFYAEFFPMFLGDAIETGQWISPSNGRKVNFAYRSEMAEALANILTDPKSHTDNTYELTSGQAYTFSELAQIIRNETGKKINYTDVATEAFIKELKKTGLSEDTVGMAKLSAETVCNGALEITTNHLEKLLGRPPKSIKDFIQDFD